MKFQFTDMFSGITVMRDNLGTTINSMECCRLSFRKILLALLLMCFTMLLMISQFTFRAHEVYLNPGSLLERNLNRLPRAYVTSWLSRNFFRLKWENMHCSSKKNDTEMSAYTKWVTKLSKTLGILDGQSLFDTNLGCLEWLKRFRSQFPSLVVAGFDRDRDAVEYAKRFFHDTTRGQFVERISQARNNSFDYAINVGGLQTMRAHKQCSAVKAILNTLKPGGVFYIGNSLERNCRSKSCKKCLAEMESIGFTILSKCFWRKTCLANERIFYEIRYVLEQDFFGSHIKDFPECRTGVFIAKSPGGSGNTNKTLSALKPSDIYDQC